jgi:hypothetical protein
VSEDYRGYRIEVYSIEERIKPSRKGIGPWIPRAKVSWKENGKWRTELLTQDRSYRFRHRAETAAIAIAKQWIEDRQRNGQPQIPSGLRRKPAIDNFSTLTNPKLETRNCELRALTPPNAALSIGAR